MGQGKARRLESLTEWNGGLRRRLAELLVQNDGNDVMVFVIVVLRTCI